MKIQEESKFDDETPELFSDSIIQMHNDLRNSPLYPEPSVKESKESKQVQNLLNEIKNCSGDNEANNNSLNETNPGNLIPYNEDSDIETKLKDVSSSSSISNSHMNNVSLDPDYNLLDYNNNEVQTLQDEMEAVIYNEDVTELEPSNSDKEITPKYPDKPSQVLFPENDGSLESLLLMLKVPPTQDVFQLIVQNAMGNDLPVSQKVFLTLENNGYIPNVNFPSTAYNHLCNKDIDNNYIQNHSIQPNIKGTLSSENSNKVIIKNSDLNNNGNDGTTFNSLPFEASKHVNFSQLRTKKDRQRLQQYQKQKRRASTDFMDLVSQVPYWVDWDKISKGQEVFWKYGLPLWISITLYAMTKGAILPLPDPLEATKNFKGKKPGSSSVLDEAFKTNELLPSYLETSQIIIESMMPDSLRPGGVAWKSLIQIRCRHAQFRVDYVDTSYDLDELHDYLSDGIKYYERKNRREKGKKKENWEMDKNGNLHLAKPKHEVKGDVKIIEFTHPPQTNPCDHHSDKSGTRYFDAASNLITYTSSNEDNKVDEDDLEINMMRNPKRPSTSKLEPSQDQSSNYYPTPSSSPTPNDNKNKVRSSNAKSSPTTEDKLPPVQKEVMSLPTELLDSLFPINQISLAKTILYLSIGSVKAMERTFGIVMGKEELDNYLLVWRYISWVCGLEDKRGKNYGNKIITPKYAEIAINYFLEKDPLVSWDDELIYHAQGIINSLSLTVPLVGSTPLMKSIVNEMSRKFTYFTSMPIVKDVPYTLTITLPNNETKVVPLNLLSSLLRFMFSPFKKVEDESSSDSSTTSTFEQFKKQYSKKGKESGGKKGEEASSSGFSLSTSSPKYNRYKKKVDRNMQIIHGRKSYVSSGIASIFIALVRYINTILGHNDIGVYFMNKINQSLIPKLIWIANNYQWVDFSRRSCNKK